MKFSKEFIAGVAVTGLVIWMVTPASSATKRKTEQVARAVDVKSPFSQTPPPPPLSESLASLSNEVGRFSDSVSSQLSSFKEPPNPGAWEAFKAELSKDGKASHEEVKRLAALMGDAVTPSSLK